MHYLRVCNRNRYSGEWTSEINCRILHMKTIYDDIVFAFVPEHDINIGILNRTAYMYILPFLDFRNSTEYQTYSFLLIKIKIL